MYPEKYIPKEVIQQNEFFKKYPEYDGRGIKIAIIDSVVDMSLPGLQKTSTGLPKIIECMGKPMITIDTSKIVERNGKNYFYINGLSGQRLIISPKWKNPSDKWHLGSINFKEFYDITIEYDGRDFKYTDIKNDQFASLNDTIIDCIVWFDGKKWRTCIDNTFSKTWLSDLKNAKVLSNYDDEHGYAYLINKSIYCVNVCDDGNSLQIMYPHDYHGTIVTHVAAAYFPDGKTEGNGLAPGAQIFSIHWKSFVKAIWKCIELKVDIINISIDFLYEYPLINLLKKLIEQHAIIITTSASNHGPFYSSIPDRFLMISHQIFRIGSVFTNEMKSIFYHPEILQSFDLTPAVIWSSGKGPLPSGARGIDFVAPGVVITDLPKWYSNKRKQPRCGTSFAAPNVAGSIACLLSALKANGIPYSPGMIKMALSNTAFLPNKSDKLAFGNGIIQILDAFEFIKKSINFIPQQPIIPLASYGPHQKGIIFVHNNDSNNNNAIKNYCFYINPEFNIKQWILKCTAASNGKINFITHCKSVTNNFFNVQINTTLLKNGNINYAEIHGYDLANPSIGPLFHLPITVIYPADAIFFADKIFTVKPGPTTSFFFKKISTESQRCSIKFTLLNNRKITLTCFYNNIVKDNITYDEKRNLEFTGKKKINTLLCNIKADEKEYFEICICHKDSIALNFKMEIEFIKEPFYG